MEVAAEVEVEVAMAGDMDGPAPVLAQSLSLLRAIAGSLGRDLRD